MKRVVTVCVSLALVVLLIIFTPSTSAEPRTPIPPATLAAYSPYPYPSYLPLLLTHKDPTPTWTPGPTTTPTSTTEATRASTPTLTHTSTATPTVTPTQCYGAAQVVLNPSFETGWWPWMIQKGYPERTSAHAADGLYSVWFGGYNDAMDWLVQDMIAPQWADDAALYFCWRMISEDSPLQSYDYLTLWLWDEDVGEGLLYAEVNNTATRGYGFSRCAQLAPEDVIAARGHTLRVVIGGYTNSTLPTEWFVDNVRLYFACGGYVP